MGIFQLIAGSFFTIFIVWGLSLLIFKNNKNLGDLSYNQEESIVPESLDYSHVLFVASISLIGLLILIPNIEQLRNLNSDRFLIFGFYALGLFAYLILNKQLWKK